MRVNPALCSRQLQLYMADHGPKYPWTIGEWDSHYFNEILSKCVVVSLIVEVKGVLQRRTHVCYVLVRLGVVGYLVDLRTLRVLLLRHDH